MQKKKTILFGMTGDALAMDSYAAIRLLRDGYNIQAMLTESARHYVSETELEKLTGNPAVSRMFTQPPNHNVEHIELARAADCFVIAPATRDFAHKLAQGMADDMLLTTALAVTAPRVLFPTADCRPEDIAALRWLGYAIVEQEYLESPRKAICRVVEEQLRTTAHGYVAKPEAIVCDLDGSLLNSRKQIHPDDLAAIASAKAQGVKFFVATGRHFDLARQTVSAVGFDYPVCACNGAHIYDYRSKRTLYASEPMPQDIVSGMLEYLHENELSYLIYTTDMVIFDRPDSPRSQYWQAQLEKFDESNRFSMRYYTEPDIDVPGSHVLKFLLAYVGEDVKQDIESRFNSKGELRILYSAKELLDINVANSSKGMGVRELSRLYNFSLENTLVLGDNYNDTSMLEICGAPVVPQNGEKNVQNIAKYITTDNDNAPLSHALEALYPGLL